MSVVLSEVIHRTLDGFAARVEAFGPSLLAALTILAAGALAAVALRVGARGGLRRLGFDRFAHATGLSLVLEKGGVASAPSRVIGDVLFWTSLAVFLLIAVAALDIQIAMDLLTRALSYLPQLLIAVAILVFGSLWSGFVKRSVLIAAVNAGLPSARLVAGGVHAILMVVVFAMALEHIGVGRQIVVVAFTVLLSGVVFALSLSFGLAGRDLAHDMLERLIRRREREDLRHL